MATRETMTNDALLQETARTPEHVVYRPFVKETVVLNLQTGKYHGVNPTGGRMLEVVERSETIGAAAKQLANEFETPLEVIEADLCDFCRDLLERGLIELRAPDGDK